MRNGASGEPDMFTEHDRAGAFVHHDLGGDVDADIQSFHGRDMFTTRPWNAEGSVVFTIPAFTGTAVPFPKVPSMASAVRMAVVKSGCRNNTDTVSQVSMSTATAFSTMAPAGTTPAA